MLIILVLVFLYWFITMLIQLGISAADIEDKDRDTRTAYCMAIFAGWIFVPIFIGEALGLYIRKAIKERYS